MKSDSISNFVNNAMDRFIDPGMGCRDLHFKCFTPGAFGVEMQCLTNRAPVSGFAGWRE